MRVIKIEIYHLNLIDFISRIVLTREIEFN